MEKRFFQPRCLLGILDEPVTDGNQHLVSWDTNKLGGFPDLLIGDMPAPTCQLCQWDLALVVQIYAPLEGSPYHRTLYVFGCVNKTCWGKSESWTIYRCQRLEDSYCEGRRDPYGKQTNAIEWIDSSDDWGTEDDEDLDGNSIFATPPNSGSPHHHAVQGRQGPSGWEKEKCATHPDTFAESQYCGNAFNENKTMDPRNLNNHGSPQILDEQGNARDIFAERCQGAAALTENVAKLHLGDSGGNGAMEGAVGISHDLDASAEIEPPDEGTISLDTPVMPSVESVAAIFGSPNDMLPSLGTKPVLKSYFLAVDMETLTEKEIYNEHERELLSRYQRQEGLNINQLHNITKQMDSNGGGEIYEKTNPKHGDRAFHKLRNFLSACPEQLLRYNKDPHASAFLLNTMRVEDLDGGRCSYCGLHRNLEMQIMPTAVGFMRMTEVEDPVLEFGTVIIYTCSDSCWREGDSYREEKVVVQADPDDQLFNAIKSRCEM